MNQIVYQLNQKLTEQDVSRNLAAIDQAFYEIELLQKYEDSVEFFKNYINFSEIMIDIAFDMIEQKNLKVANHIIIKLKEFHASQPKNKIPIYFRWYFQNLQIKYLFETQHYSACQSIINQLFSQQENISIENDSNFQIHYQQALTILFNCELQFHCQKIQPNFKSKALYGVLKLQQSIIQKQKGQNNMLKEKALLLISKIFYLLGQAEKNSSPDKDNYYRQALKTIINVVPPEHPAVIQYTNVLNDEYDSPRSSKDPQVYSSPPTSRSDQKVEFPYFREKNSNQSDSRIKRATPLITPRKHNFINLESHKMCQIVFDGNLNQSYQGYMDIYYDKSYGELALAFIPINESEPYFHYLNLSDVENDLLFFQLGCDSNQKFPIFMSQFIDEIIKYVMISRSKKCLVFGELDDRHEIIQLSLPSFPQNVCVVLKNQMSSVVYLSNEDNLNTIDFEPLLCNQNHWEMKLVSESDDIEPLLINQVQLTDDDEDKIMAKLSQRTQTNQSDDVMQTPSLPVKSEISPKKYKYILQICKQKVMFQNANNPLNKLEIFYTKEIFNKIDENLKKTLKKNDIRFEIQKMKIKNQFFLRNKQQLNYLIKFISVMSLDFPEQIIQYRDMPNILQNMEERGYIQNMGLCFKEIFQNEIKFAQKRLKQLMQIMKENGKYFDFNDQFTRNTNIFKKNFDQILQIIVRNIWDETIEDYHNRSRLNLYSSLHENNHLRTQQINTSLLRSGEYSPFSIQNHSSIKHNSQRKENNILKKSRQSVLSDQSKTPKPHSKSRTEQHINMSVSSMVSMRSKFGQPVPFSELSYISGSQSFAKAIRNLDQSMKTSSPGVGRYIQTERAEKSNFTNKKGFKQVVRESSPYVSIGKAPKIFWIDEKTKKMDKSPGPIYDVSKHFCSRRLQTAKK